MDGIAGGRFRYLDGCIYFVVLVVAIAVIFDSIIFVDVHLLAIDSDIDRGWADMIKVHLFEY